MLGAAASLFGGRSGGGMDVTPIVNAIEQLGNDIRGLEFQVNMDGRKVAEGVNKVNQRNTTNDFGVAV